MFGLFNNVMFNDPGHLIVFDILEDVHEYGIDTDSNLIINVHMDGSVHRHNFDSNFIISVHRHNFDSNFIINIKANSDINTHIIPTDKSKFNISSEHRHD